MKTRTILTTLLVAIAASSLSAGIAGAADPQTPDGGQATIAGAAEDCTCQGAGRVATCEAPCTCDYDWQGYPRCTSTADTSGLRLPSE